jgi:membrane protease YdiL (CAAX protease family)
MIISSNSPKENFIPSITRIITVLASFQLTRALLYWILTKFHLPAGGDITNVVSLALTGLLIWIVFKPVKTVIGLLRFPKSGASSRIMVWLLLVILAGMNLYRDPSQLMPTIASCVVFPLFEEPIFRGWIWSRMAAALPARANELLTLIVSTVLFALWHLGYWDVVAIHVRSSTSFASLTHIMLMKMVVASIIGLLAGFLRWKTGKIYASILFHAFWNLFGR